MNRRDFLFLRTEGRQRVLEVSCEELYVRFADATWSALEQAGPAEGDPWLGGEPPAVLDRPDRLALFAGLESDLEAVDVVRVRGSEWLVQGELRDRVHALLDQFRARGGRVRFEEAGAGNEP